MYLFFYSMLVRLWTGALATQPQQSLLVWYTCFVATAVLLLIVWYLQ